MDNLKKLPRVAAIHDMCGFGKCSLTTALPVISSCGIEVCPIPTGIFSANTTFEGFEFTDFTAQMPKFIEHLKKININFDAIYSGYLGSCTQIKYIKNFVNMFSPKYTIIDPVMGDDGKIYATYTPQMCRDMRLLVSIADFALPNLTECCILTEKDFNTVDTSQSGIKELAINIANIGAKNVIITGIERNNKLYNCILSDGNYIEREIELLPFRMHGTGDLFGSVFTGGILSGHTIVEAVDSSAQFVFDVMKYSKTIEGSEERGTCFEPLLYRLSGGLCKKTNN